MRSVSASREPVVVLIEPHADTRAMYAEFFRHEGLPLTCVHDAAHALRLAPRAAVIVTGLLLPGAVDGYTLIARLRADPITTHTPIIVVTACVWETERARATEAGCDLFLPKPCLPGHLLVEVRRLLASRRSKPVRGTPAKYRTTRGERTGLRSRKVPRTR